MTNYVHDPQAVLDYAIDWSAWLAASETISASTWTVQTGLTEAPAGHSATTTTATIWLTGGTLMTSYAVTNHITTNQGRQQDQTITLQVRDR